MQQDLIAARVAVGVVERLEMIQVEVAGDEAAAARYPLGQMSVDLAVAGQARERIRMSGCLDLLRGDLPQQIDGSAESQIQAVARDDEVIALAMRAARRHHAAHLIEP